MNPYNILLPKTLSNFYNTTVNFDKSLSDVPKSLELAEFATENKWQSQFFIQFATETYYVEVPVNSFLPSLGTKKESRERITGIYSIEQMPFDTAIISFETEEPSLPPKFNLYIAFIHSRTHVLILYGTIQYSRQGWDKLKQELSTLKWEYSQIMWKDVASNPSLIYENACTSAETAINSVLDSLVQQLF